MDGWTWGDLRQVTAPLWTCFSLCMLVIILSLRWLLARERCSHVVVEANICKWDLLWFGAPGSIGPVVMAPCVLLSCCYVIVQHHGAGTAANHTNLSSSRNQDPVGAVQTENERQLLP